ncbi:MAG: DUF4007 family protein [Armatimonadota bacterium]
MPPVGKGAVSGDVPPSRGNTQLSAFRTFFLLRDGIRQVLECVASGGTGLKNIRERTNLGTVQVEAMHRFAKAASLLDERDALTELGRTFLANDSALADRRTQWIVHYKLVAPYSTAPGFWRQMFDYVANRTVVNPGDLRAYARECAGRQVGERAATQAYLAFVGTYTRTEGLGSLGVLAAENDELVVGQINLPHPRVVAYVVGDYWDHVWPGRQSVNLSWLSEPGGPASLLLMNSGEMADALKDMQNAGLIEVQRRYAPYQVFRLWKDTNELLKRIYE